MPKVSKALKIAALFAWFSTAASAATFKDAVKGLGPGNTGVLVARELIGVLNLMSERLSYDEKARQFFLFLNDALEDFDFARLYESPYLTPASGGFKHIVLSGKNQGSGYQVSLGDAPADKSALGNARAEYRMRKNEIQGDKTYTTQLEFEAALKKFDAQAMARFIEGFLRVLDPENMKKLQAPASDAFPEIKTETRKVFDQGMADFPQTTRMLSKYLEFRSFAEIKDAGGKAYTDVSLRGHFRMAALEADYPQIRKFLKDIRNLFILQVYIGTGKGQNLMSVIINTQTEEFFVGFKTAGGKVIPMQKDGVPAFSEAVTLTGVSDQKFFVALNAFVNVYGLKINTGNIGAYLRYQANLEKMSFFAKITSIPEGKISGALFGMVPTWVIDLSIPSDLQTLMNKFSQTILKANNGEGSRAEIAWLKHGGDAALKASASTEFLENRFIRIGMKIWVRKFRPNESVQEDIRLFIGRFTRAILADLNTM